MGALTGLGEVPVGPEAPPALPTDVVPFVRLLATAVAVAIDSLHAELARAGHPSLRPVQGFALNAIGTGADTASALADRLRMTKQGAAKIVRALVDEGYVQIGAGLNDGRRKPLVLTPRGRSVVAASVDIQAETEARWAELVGREEMTVVRTALQEAILAESGGIFPVVRPT